ncbi:MAG TPA: hypothetical protein VLF39_04280 [Candidatus Saccharimonadales bacterium]|nr:hypothetical protein [Candidatus Saccharimonadales bacterium]
MNPNSKTPSSRPTSGAVGGQYYGDIGKSPSPIAGPTPAAGHEPPRPQNYSQFTPMGQAAPAPGAPGGPRAPLPPHVINPNSTQNMLQIAEIRDGLVIMNDGSFRSIVMARSINFDLMSPDERETIEYAYQGFLNSLHFPVQIFIRTERVDIRPYLERLDNLRRQQDNMLLALLMEDYIGYVEELASQTNIMDKKFYLVVPYFPVADIQKAITQSKNFFTGLIDMFNKKARRVTINEAELNNAKVELRERVQGVLAGLQQASIKALPLDTQELIELYYDIYNPDTATRQQLKNFDGISEPVVTKGEGEAPQPGLTPENNNG